MTNFEKIKQMRVEEFAKFLTRFYDCTLCGHCCIENSEIDCKVKWLESEADTEQKGEKDDAEIH